MAGRGPAPKPASERVRRNLDAIPTVAVFAGDDLERGFDLPDLEPDELGARRWPAMTRRWWDRWRKSPQAQTFTETDWDFLLETALIHRAFILGDLKQAAELRLRVSKFGATPEDRMRLRLQIATPAESGPRRPSAASIR